MTQREKKVDNKLFPRTSSYPTDKNLTKKEYNSIIKHGPTETTAVPYIFSRVKISLRSSSLYSKRKIIMNHVINSRRFSPKSATKQQTVTYAHDDRSA